MAKRKKLTRADFTEYRGYFYRKAPSSETRCRLYQPDGRLICETGLDDAQDYINKDIERQKAASRMDL